jgi:hypothetical protein
MDWHTFKPKSPNRAWDKACRVSMVSESKLTSCRAGASLWPSVSRARASSTVRFYGACTVYARPGTLASHMVFFSKLDARRVARLHQQRPTTCLQHWHRVHLQGSDVNIVHFGSGLVWSVHEHHVRRSTEHKHARGWGKCYKTELLTIYLSDLDVWEWSHLGQIHMSLFVSSMDPYFTIH